jgi:hypothetical protein
MPLRLLAVALLLAATRPAAGEGVAVLVNRSDRDVSCTASTADGRALPVTVARGDLAVLRVRGATTLSFLSSGKPKTLSVPECSVCAFGGRGGELRPEPLFTAKAAAPTEPSGALTQPVVGLPVKILVDDREPSVRAVWEARLRKRVAAASEVLEHHCRVRLEVVAVGTWKSSPEAKDYGAQLTDFERKVPARPARLVIGFSSRALVRDPSAPFTAATPVPLRSHILIGEWYSLAEFQRLEVLLHELGHHFGAVHSPEAETVMRITPGDARSMQRDFRIGYDPLNALAMNLVAAEAGPRTRKLGALAPATRARLAEIYKTAARLQPEDPTPEKYLGFLDDVRGSRPARTPDPLVDGARAVVAAAVAAAEDAAEQELGGDRLTERCVRSAAAAAARLPEAQRVPAFLLGTAVALDTSDLLRKAATTRGLWERVEDDDEREERLKMVTRPTLHGSHRVARHYFVAGAMTAIAGARSAEPGGIVQDLFAAEPAGGFSFADLAAELSGAALARSLTEDPARLGSVAAGFTAAGYVASPAGLEESLSRDEFNRRYGSVTDERFRGREAEVRRRVSDLAAQKSN